MTLARFLLVLAAIPAAASTIALGPERPVSSLSYAPPPEQQRPGAIASDGMDYMLFWDDEGDRRAGLYATRISASGEVSPIPQQPIRIATYVRSISACWTGTSYLVTWSDDEQQAVMAATLARDGSLISAPHVIAPGAFTFSGALAWNGQRALQVILATGSPTATGVLLDASGSVVRSQIGLPVTYDQLAQLQTVKSSSDGSRFAVFWSTVTYVRASSTPPPPTTPVGAISVAFLDGNGMALNPGGTLLAKTGQVTGLAAAFGADRFAVVANDGTTFRRLIVNPATGGVHELSSMPAGGSNPSVIWDGAEFVASWIAAGTSTSFFTLPFTADETVPASPFISLHRDTLATDAILGTNGTSILAAWMDLSRGGVCCVDGDLFAALLPPHASASATPTAAFPAAYAAEMQTAPAIASSGSESLIVWIEAANDTTLGDVLATRVAADGTVLDSPPLKLGSDASMFVTPAVAFTGSSFWAVWQQGESPARIFARQIQRNGDIGAAVDLGAGNSPAIASNGSTTLAVFTNPLIIGVRLEDPAVTPFVISDHYGFRPMIATNGDDFLVCWTEGSEYWQFPSPNLYDVVGARVHSNATVDSSPIAIATGPKSQALGAVGSDGRDFLVLYLLGGERLAAKRVLREGALADTTSSDDGVIVAPEIAAYRLPAIAWDGSAYLAAWQSTSVGVQKIDRLGNPLGTPAALADESAEEPVLASASGGPPQLAYVRFATEAIYGGAMRVFARAILDVQPRTRRVR